MSGPRKYVFGRRVEDRRVGEAEVGVDVAADDQRAAVGELDVARAEEVPRVRDADERSRGRDPRGASSSAPASQPSQARTCPVGSSDMCTATSGHATGALHCPTWSGVAAVAAREPPSCMSATTTAHERERQALPRRDQPPELVECGQLLSARSSWRRPRRHALLSARARRRTTAARSGRPSRASRFPRSETLPALRQRRIACRAHVRSRVERTALARLRGDALGREREPVGGHRHEDELEPEGAEDRRREDVAERDDGAGGQQRRPGRLSDAVCRTSSSSATTPPTR